jgi:hypothetical protein
VTREQKNSPAAHAVRFLAALTIQLLLIIVAALPCHAEETAASDAFRRGSDEYAAGHFPSAAFLFRAASSPPAAGALYNLGDAEWQCERPGPAILAWEQAQWLNPFNHNISANLRYARKVRQLDAPELAWYEICSTWLPVNWWPWLACAGFWLAAAMMTLPGIFGWRKAGWQQGLAAASFAVFLLTIPTLAGVHTRSRLGIILPKDTALRVTPTKDAQELTRLPEGETVRLERTRGNYLFIRTANASGWIERNQFGLISR